MARKERKCLFYSVVSFTCENLSLLSEWKCVIGKHFNKCFPISLTPLEIETDLQRWFTTYISVISSNSDFEKTSQGQNKYLKVLKPKQDNQCFFGLPKLRDRKG